MKSPTSKHSKNKQTNKQTNKTKKTTTTNVLFCLFVAVVLF